MLSEALTNLKAHGGAYQNLVTNSLSGHEYWGFTTATVTTSGSADINALWITTATFLVLFMQIGFLALESGWVRSKNSISVAQRNLADFCICFLIFYMFGYMFAFGSSQGGLFGWNWSEHSKMIDDHIDHFLFQAVFAGAAVTIASGTLAERMSFKSYLVLAAITSFILYPLVCHWAWGNSIDKENTAWLSSLGFVDFAGSTVVHSTGGWIAFACAILLGPRADKFDKDGNPVALPCHSMVLAGIGALILLISWIGFNAGTSQVGSPVFKHIILNTLLAGSSGMLAALVFGAFMDKSFEPKRTTNGLLGGLVGVTASCHAIDANSAIMIGLICGIIVCLSEDFIERKLKVDDVVGAVSVHGVCGAVGTILFAVLAPLESLPTGNRITQIGVQTFGVAVVFTYVFCLGYMLLTILNNFIPLRITRENEERGSNLAEHNITLETEMLLESERAVNEEQKQFIRMATHEFRTPLSIIDTLSQNLKRRWHKFSQEKATEKIDGIQKAVKRLTNLIDTVLNAGKAEHGNIQYNPEPVQVTAYLHEKLEQFKLMAERHEITLNLNDTESAIIQADTSLMDNILDNLVSNAIKYSPDADRIDINVSRSARNLTIEVRDYGLGIPKDELPKMFGKYFRASTSAGIGGTGIGLTVVKKFVEMHDGTISLESTLGEGTSFILTFPLDEQERAKLIARI
ncbi:MAG: ATP-binding protein [Methyloligellaceae bacterium]